MNRNDVMNWALARLSDSREIAQQQLLAILHDERVAANLAQAIKLRDAVQQQLRERLEQLLPDERLQQLEKRFASLAEHTGDATDIDVKAHLAQLVDAALEQTPEMARDTLIQHTVKQLLPDEARILSAMSDHQPRALVHLHAVPLVGIGSRTVLSNYSSVGKDVGLQRRDFTPIYIGRLRNFGLIKTGSEDETLATQYELLESENTLRHLATEIDQPTNQRAKFIRATLHLTTLGQELCGLAFGTTTNNE